MTKHISSLYLGIDGGGTKCRVRLEDAQGKLLAEAVSGAANISTSVTEAQQSIIDAAQQALAAANLPPSLMAHIHAYAGLAGAGIESSANEMSLWQHPFASFNFSTDLHIACHGAHDGNDGAIIILGTGFCAGAIDNTSVIELGGHGLMLSDGASGSWMGLTLFRYALEVLDGLSQPTELIQMLLNELNCENSSQLTQLAINEKPVFFARFAPLVFQMQSDPLAITILNQATSFTCRYIKHLVSLGFNNISLMGGIAGKIGARLPHDAGQYLCPAQYSPEQAAVELAKQHNS